MTTLINRLFPEGRLDKTGAIFSWACSIHCIAMPILISLFPILGLSFFAEEGIELVFLAISVIIAGITIVPGYFRKHRRLRTLILFAAGLSLIFMADAIFEENLLGKAVTLALGAGGITLAHYLNVVLCRDCSTCSNDKDAAAHC